MFACELARVHYMCVHVCVCVCARVCVHVFVCVHVCMCARKRKVTSDHMTSHMAQHIHRQRVDKVTHTYLPPRST